MRVNCPWRGSGADIKRREEQVLRPTEDRAF